MGLREPVASIPPPVCLVEQIRYFTPTGLDTSCPDAVTRGWAGRGSSSTTHNLESRVSLQRALGPAPRAPAGWAGARLGSSAGDGPVPRQGPRPTRPCWEHVTAGGGDGAMAVAVGIPADAAHGTHARRVIASPGRVRDRIEGRCLVGASSGAAPGRSDAGGRISTSRSRTGI
jgi:hypothetical protein